VYDYATVKLVAFRASRGNYLISGGWTNVHWSSPWGDPTGFIVAHRPSAKSLQYEGTDNTWQYIPAATQAIAGSVTTKLDIPLYKHTTQVSLWYSQCRKRLKMEWQMVGYNGAHLGWKLTGLLQGHSGTVHTPLFFTAGSDNIYVGELKFDAHRASFSRNHSRFWSSCRSAEAGRAHATKHQLSDFGFTHSQTLYQPVSITSRENAAWFNLIYIVSEHPRISIYLSIRHTHTHTHIIFIGFSVYVRLDPRR
jgi:hypothetical protein